MSHRHDAGTQRATRTLGLLQVSPQRRKDAASNLDQTFSMSHRIDAGAQRSRWTARLFDRTLRLHDSSTLGLPDSRTSRTLLHVSPQRRKDAAINLDSWTFSISHRNDAGAQRSRWTARLFDRTLRLPDSSTLGLPDSRTSRTLLPCLTATTQRRSDLDSWTFSISHRNDVGVQRSRWTARLFDRTLRLPDSPTLRLFDSWTPGLVDSRTPRLVDSGLPDSWIPGSFGSWFQPPRKPLHHGLVDLRRVLVSEIRHHTQHELVAGAGGLVCALGRGGAFTNAGHRRARIGIAVDDEYAASARRAAAWPARRTRRKCPVRRDRRTDARMPH